MNSSSIQEIIAQRRTTKTENFNGQIIEEQLIDQLLTAADWAPTHGYTEPWRFRIYRGDGIRDFCRLHANLYKRFTPAESFSQNSFNKIAERGDTSSHMLACWMKRGENPKIPEIEELAATACAIQNILLSASALGVSVYWGTGGMVHHNSMKELLGLAPQDHMMGLLFLGYSDKEHSKGRRVVPLSEKVTKTY